MYIIWAPWSTVESAQISKNLPFDSGSLAGKNLTSFKDLLFLAAVFTDGGTFSMNSELSTDPHHLFVAVFASSPERHLQLFMTFTLTSSYFGLPFITSS
jgi:hypothetical protein